jgi:hypothetical protein
MWQSERYDLKYPVTFDVLTIYEIAKKRGQCVENNKNYAKIFVLQIFDDYVNNIIDKPQMLNLYLGYNAEVLKITPGYQRMLVNVSTVSPENWNLYLRHTEPLRKELISKIRQKIINM